MSKKLSFVVEVEASARENPKIMAENLRMLIQRGWSIKKLAVRPGRVFAEHEDVLEFQSKYDVPMRQVPGFLDQEAQDFRTKFMAEELAEFELACEEGDLPGAMDALLDLVYVVHGTALMMGLPWEEGWDEVQRANMQKIRAQSAGESKRGTALDVVKPLGWVAPDHRHALERARVQGQLAEPVLVPAPMPKPFWENPPLPRKYK